MHEQQLARVAVVVIFIVQLPGHGLFWLSLIACIDSGDHDGSTRVESCLHVATCTVVLRGKQFHGWGTPNKPLKLSKPCHFIPRNSSGYLNQLLA